MPSLLKDLKTGIGRIEFDLDQDEYCAIGRVTAQWAYLEYGIYAVSKAITTGLGIALPEDALRTSFSRRLTALRLLIEEFASDSERERMLKLVGKITNAEQDRHKITHAMWEGDRSDPEKINASSFRPGFEFEKKFDAKKIHSLADRIAAISFALEYPEGWNAAFHQILAKHTDENGNVAYANISRQQHREWTSRKAQAHMESDSATPPKRTPPQPSSKK